MLHYHLDLEFISQNNLVDPNYFNFISFTQYTIINYKMSSNLLIVFEERQIVTDNNPNIPMIFTPTIVRYKPKYLDNFKLP